MKKLHGGGRRQGKKRELSRKEPSRRIMDANRQPIGVKRGDFSMNLIQELNIFLLKGLHFILKSGGIS